MRIRGWVKEARVEKIQVNANETSDVKLRLRDLKFIPLNNNISLIIKILDTVTPIY